MEIRKGMYGLPQAGILANKLLKKRLAKHGYFEQPHIRSLFSHESHPIWFNLAVDDFGIKYIGKDTLQHLYNSLQAETYDIIEDQAGDLYCGIALKWNYAKGYVDLSMPRYVMKLPIMLNPRLSNPNIALLHLIQSHTARTTRHPIPPTRVPS
jgi:hypothetical protein